MDEIEVKVIDEDFKKIRRNLAAIGFKKKFRAKMTTYYLDYIDLRFAKTKKTLRLRWVENKGTFLCFKDTKEDSEISIYDETEVKVEDLEKTLKILKSAGFVVTDILNKTREAHEKDAIEVVFDNITGITPKVSHYEYIEIEGPNKKSINNLIRILGIKKSNIKAWNSHQIIEYVRKKVDWPPIK
ncbi:class IV adenylate cyclase [Candidatus Micrarchaeota archaeon]|nr:class IV adenylate cyclase [Candidatus Micrarchaeota archaeon]